MPGGYGTRNTPWGAGGTSSPSGSYSRSAGPGRGGGSSVTQGSNRVANVVNSPHQIDSGSSTLNNIRQENIFNAIAESGQSGDYGYAGKSFAEQELEREQAIRLQAALSMASVGVKDLAGARMGKGMYSITDPIGVNWWQGGENADILSGLGPEKYWFDEVGYLGKGENSPSFPGGGGGGGWTDYGYGGGYGGGGGSVGGGGGYAPPEDFMPQGQANEAWGAQNPLQQAMISIHGGKGFQQGFARGGIVSLVE